MTLPVLVVIHDGDWGSGSGQTMDARQLASSGLVVVTLDYRLGLLSEWSRNSNIMPFGENIVSVK